MSPALRKAGKLIPWSVFALTGCSVVLDFPSLSTQYSSGGDGGNGQTPSGGSSTATGNQGGDGAGGGGPTGSPAGSGNGGALGGSSTNPGGTSGVGGDDAGTPDTGGAPPVSAVCSNGTQDLGETDVDCGGNGCPLCGEGKECGNDGHCISSRCEDGRCQPAQCDDERKNANETDTDCGGPDCPDCLVGQSCARASDCEILENSVRSCGSDGSDMICASECAGDYLDCDASKGCEVDSRTDVANCGECDVECNGTNGVPSCVGGECRITCDDPTHYDDCNDSADDGCEINVHTSAEHCGACNQACEHECIDGKCCRQLTSASVEYDVTGCFVIRPTSNCNNLFVQNKGATIDYTLISDCDDTTTGTIGTNGTVRFNHCESRFELSDDVSVRISWWEDTCQ